MADNQDFVMTDAEAQFIVQLVLHLVRVRFFAEANGIPVEVAGPIYERLEQARRDAHERELRAEDNEHNEVSASDAAEDSEPEENEDNPDAGGEDSDEERQDEEESGEDNDSGEDNNPNNEA